jgi:hypothetical protein
MATRRIKDLPAVLVPAVGDKLVLDGATTRAIDINDFMTAVGKGAGYGGTSTTSLLIGTGAAVFTTQSGLAYVAGNYVRAASAANGANYMEGTVTSYTATTLTLNVTKVGGAGTKADWGFQVAGAPGTGDMTSTNNLSELSSPSAARTNLGLDPIVSRQTAVAHLFFG